MGRARSLAGRLGSEPEGPPEVETFDRPTDAIYETRAVVFEMPLHDCLYPHGMTYAPTGPHPFVQTLHAYRNDRTLSYEDSPLKRFYDRFQPASILELLYPPDVVERYRHARLAEFSTTSFQPFLPWDSGAVRATGEKGLGAKHGHQGFGPVSEEKGRLEFERLQSTFESIERHGYRPRSGPDGEIRGYFLTDGPRARFVVRAGQHRVASLAALEHDVARVAFLPRFTRAIDAATIPQWPLVRRGIFSEELARTFVDLQLTTDGAWVLDGKGA